MAWLIAIALAIGLLFGAYTEGGYHQRVKDEKEIAAARAQRVSDIADYVVDMSARNTALQADLFRERGNIKTEIVVLKGKVPDYVTSLSDSRCIVPLGFVQHFDAAWGLSPLPAAGSGLVDRPSGIPLSRVESINADNAGACRDIEKEARGWRTWYAAHKARYEAFTGTTQGQPQAVPAKTKGR